MHGIGSCFGLIRACRVDVMAIPTYQQLAIYFIPIFTNLAFVNILVVVARLYWFNRELKKHRMFTGSLDSHKS